MVLDGGHFGDEVGGFDEGWAGVAAGDDDVEGGGAGGQGFEDGGFVEVVVAEGDVEFVEDEEAEVGGGA